MRNYDEVGGFIDYTSKEEWKKYIMNSVLPLWRSAKIIIEYFEKLREEFDKLLLNEVKEEDKRLLLGGVDPSGTEVYSEKSLAKFYSKFFGLKLNDLQAWIWQQQYGEALAEVFVEVLETEFIKFVKEIFNTLNRGLEQQSIVQEYKEPQLNYEELKKNPEKVKELIKEFYQALLNISMNYNYGSFFLCSIKQITYKAMKTAYPRIDQALEFLQKEFGLEELRWNNPLSQDSQIYKDYTIYCFPEYNPKKQGESFGGAIVRVNELLWNVFSFSLEVKETLSMLFDKIPDLREEFRKEVELQLTEKYHSEIYFKGIAASEDCHESIIEKSGKTLMEMLDENMPWLFTSLIKIFYISERNFKFEIFW